MHIMYISQKTTPIKVHIVNIFNFAGCMVSITTIKHYPFSRKTITEYIQTNGHGCVLMKLYLQKIRVHSL